MSSPCPKFISQRRGSLGVAAKAGLKRHASTCKGLTSADGGINPSNPFQRVILACSTRLETRGTRVPDPVLSLKSSSESENIRSRTSMPACLFFLKRGPLAARARGDVATVHWLRPPSRSDYACGEYTPGSQRLPACPRHQWRPRVLAIASDCHLQPIDKVLRLALMFAAK